MARKDSRKRKASRKGRKASRRVRRSLRGGNPMALSLAQGKEYLNIHQGQRGGGAAMMGAPLDYDSLLPGDLRTAARIDVLDNSTREIAGMRDDGAAYPSPMAPQAGGKRRKSKASTKAR
jgi:hypothetical protein